MASQRLDFKIRNRMAELDRIVDNVADYAQQVGLPQRCRFQLNLVLEEIFSNIIHYSFPDGDDHWIEITLVCGTEEMTVTIRDDGKPFNPLTVNPPDLDCTPDLREPGGLGIHMTRHFSNSMDYARRNGKNILTLTIRLEEA